MLLAKVYSNGEVNRFLLNGKQLKIRLMDTRLLIGVNLKYATPWTMFRNTRIPWYCTRNNDPISNIYIVLNTLLDRYR